MARHLAPLGVRVREIEPAHCNQTLVTAAEVCAFAKIGEMSHTLRVRVPGVVTCKDKCCEFSQDPADCERGCGSDTAYDVQSICFGGVGDVWFVEKVDFYNYLSSMP